MQAELYNNSTKVSRHFPFRFFSLGSLFCTLLVLLTACGGSTSSSSGGKITLTEMDYWSVPAQGATLNKLFAQYEKLHPNITIQRTAVPFANLISKADQEAASHTLPNIMALDNPDVAQFASTGALTSLDTYMQGNFSDADFYAGSLTAMKYQGKIYSIPVGNNDLAIFYNKKEFAAAKLQPPTTWSELVSAAKALTHGNTYGLAFSATADEQASFQFEPFLWSNNGDLTKLNSKASVEALQVLVDIVQQGGATKGVLNWGQPDVGTQFGEGNAAMMLNGPWEIPALDQQYHMKFGTDYGVVSLPVPHAGDKPVGPLGGESWTIPANSDPAVTKASWDLVNWLEQPEQLRQLDEGFGYIPAVKKAAQLVLKDNPNLQVFADELDTARARTAQLGAKYPKVSHALRTAEQSALTGSLSAQAALNQAQQQITPVLNS